FAFRWTKIAYRRRCRDIRHHCRERLFDSSFTLAQERDGVRIRRVDSQVKSPETFYGYDLAVLQCCGSIGDSVMTRKLSASLNPKFNLWATFPAGIRLGVKSPVERIFVLFPASRAHRKHGHRCARPVIRNIADNGETRPAVGAIDEGIQVSAI